MGSAVPQGGSFADAHESPIHVAIRSDMGRANMKGFRVGDKQEWRFQSGNLEMWVMPSCKGFD